MMASIYKAKSFTQKEYPMAKHDDDNRSNQLNPNNDAYWSSRGEDERPQDWDQSEEDEG